MVGPRTLVWSRPRLLRQTTLASRNIGAVQAASEANFADKVSCEFGHDAAGQEKTAFKIGGMASGGSNCGFNPGAVPGDELAVPWGCRLGANVRAGSARADW